MNEKRITLDDITVGTDVRAHWLACRGASRGGIVTAIRDGHFTMQTNEHDWIVQWDEVSHWTVEVPHDAEECLNYSEHCSGPVEMWHSGGMNGRSWPRCTFHRDQRWAQEERSIERYADSDIAPEWFDESYAGERWGDDY